METKKWYAVYGLFSRLDVQGFTGKLKDGMKFIPCFDDYDKAKDFAGDKFDIVELSINE